MLKRIGRIYNPKKERFERLREEENYKEEMVKKNKKKGSWKNENQLQELWEKTKRVKDKIERKRLKEYEDKKRKEREDKERKRIRKEKKGEIRKEKKKKIWKEKREDKRRKKKRKAR